MRRYQMDEKEPHTYCQKKSYTTPHHICCTTRVREDGSSRTCSLGKVAEQRELHPLLDGQVEKKHGVVCTGREDFGKTAHLSPSH